jgi:tripartite-type tricarboxylate transporter receptor subunit TctC
MVTPVLDPIQCRCKENPMKNHIRSLRRFNSCFGPAMEVGWAVPSAHAADAYPCSVAKLVSPYPPGGTTEILARLIAPGLSKGLGCPVVAENQAGAIDLCA